MEFGGRKGVTFFPEFLTQANKQGHMGEGGGVVRKEMEDPGGDIEKAVDSVQWTQAQRSSQGWRGTLPKAQCPGKRAVQSVGRGEPQNRPEQHQPSETEQMEGGEARTAGNRKSHQGTVPCPFSVSHAPVLSGYRCHFTTAGKHLTLPWCWEESPAGWSTQPLIYLPKHVLCLVT